MQGAPVQFKALADVTWNNSNEAYIHSLAAAGSAESAGAQAGNALTYRNQAETQANGANAHRAAALGYRNEAEGFKNQAATSATALTDTSTTSVTIGLGVQYFNVPTGKQFEPGVDMKVSNGANAMYGTVNSYSGGVLAVNVTSVIGSGTFASWNISVVGQRGATGPAGSFAGGSDITLAGNTPVIVFDEADQSGGAGKWRVVADGGAWRVDRNTAAARDFSTAVSPLKSLLPQ